MKYRGFIIEIDQDFEGAEWVYLYPPGAVDYGMDPIECESVKRAQQIADDMITDIDEHYKGSSNGIPYRPTH